MKKNEKEVKSIIRSMEKKDIDTVSSLRRSLEDRRKYICVSLGGHFWSDPFLLDSPMFFDPYKVDLVKECSACRTREVLVADAESEAKK